jgi:hypothetical protein
MMKALHSLTIFIAFGIFTASCTSKHATTNPSDQSGVLADHVNDAETDKSQQGRKKQTEPEPTPPFTLHTLSNFSLEVTEDAHDGPHPLKPEVLAKTDANSTLVVKFNPPPYTTLVGEMPDPRWQRVVSILAKAEDLAKSRAALNAEDVDLNRSEQVDQLKRRAREEDQKVVSLYNDMEQLGLDQKTIRSILSGAFDGKGTRAEPYANLARWLRKEIETLEREALEFARSKEKLRVTVQAMLNPIVGSTKYLHIEDYDSLPEGEYRPIDRYGLNLTEAEKQRFQFEYKQANLVKDSIVEIEAQRKTIQRASKKWLSDIEGNLNELKNSLIAESGGIVTTINKIIKKLETTIPTSSATNTEKRKATESLTILKALGQDMSEVASFIDKLKEASKIIRGTTNMDLNELLDPEGLFNTLNALVAEFTKVKEISEKSGETFKAFTKTIPDLSKFVAKEELQQLTEQPTENFFETLSKDLPKTTEAIEAVKETLLGNAKLVKGAETLANTDQKTIPHTFDNLVPARVELPRAGLTIGDHITLKVKVAPIESDGTSLGPTTESVNYKAEAILTGLHRRIGADLIFARGFGSDDARKWRPNVAARGEWHYLIREPEDNGQRFWNWLDPGFGLHVASLNQGPESIQVGLGVNLSFWNNFVSFGYGQNLSTQHQYVFVGINLLNVLNKAKGAIGD